MKHEDYTIGWICALPIEAAAAYGVLDERHDTLLSSSTDSNNYTFGRVGQHNVVIACLPSGVMGKASAARVVERMLFTFSALRFALMVGTGGGVPSADHDVRLGDVVVGKPAWSYGGVVQYDYGKTVQDDRFVRTGSLNRPPDVLLTASANLEAKTLVDGHRILDYLSETIKKFPNLTKQFTSPGPDRDFLYNLEYDHPEEEPTCSKCKQCELVQREPRSTGEIVVHYGLIASADQVMKHGRTRERLRRELDLLCFETEAAGLMDAVPCLVIRGICNYSDSHKNYQWQPFAAAYAKELLGFISPTTLVGEKPAVQIIEGRSIPTNQETRMTSSVASQENVPPATSPGFEVDATFLLLKSLLPKDDMKLERFVRRPQHPGEGYAPQTPNVPQELLSESIEEDVNRILVQEEVHNKSFRSALTRVFGLGADKVQTTVETLRSSVILTRRFNNADTILQDLLTQDTRNWLKAESPSESRALSIWSSV